MNVIGNTMEATIELLDKMKVGEGENMVDCARLIRRV